MIWITIDVGLAKHPKMAALPNDTARYGWLVALCEAKVQRQPGRFASDRHFAQVVGRFARYLPDYLKARLFDKEDDGALLVHDWPQHQWAVKKQRQREDIEGTTEGQKGDNEGTEKGLAGASRAVAVSVPVFVPSSGEGSGEGLPRLVEELTARPFGYSPGSRVMATLFDDSKALGADRVEGALREEHAAANGRPLDAASLVFGAHKRLYPLATERRPKPNSAHLADLEAAVERS